jgi:hypothetical protein
MGALVARFRFSPLSIWISVGASLANHKVSIGKNDGKI